MADTASGRRRFEVVALFAPRAAGTAFGRTALPAHVTIAPSFTTAALVDEIGVAVFGGTLTSAPLVVRFGEVATLDSDGDAPVRLVQHLPVTIEHRRLAERLEALTEFTPDDSRCGRDGYRPHLPLHPGTAAEEEEQRRVQSIALLELHDATAAITAIREIDDLTEWDRVDMPVALPVGADPDTVQVVQVGGDSEYPSDMTIETADGLRISTVRRTGIRWRSDGWVPAESTLTEVALHAISRVLAESVPFDLSPEEIARLEKAAERDATRLAALLRDTAAWDVGPVLVEGVPYALFTIDLTRNGSSGAAAVADLGSLHVSITGPQLPDRLALQLLPASRLARSW